MNRMMSAKTLSYKGFTLTITEWVTRFGSVFQPSNSIEEPMMGNDGYATLGQAIIAGK